MMHREAPSLKDKSRNQSKQKQKSVRQWSPQRIQGQSRGLESKTETGENRTLQEISNSLRLTIIHTQSSRTRILLCPLQGAAVRRQRPSA